MREIKLSQGKVALVDEDDYDFLMQWKWHLLKSSCTDYAVRQELRSTNPKSRYRNVYMHRVIMTPHISKVVDHINHNGLDNRKENLRIVTHRENLSNRRVSAKSGYPGVYPYRGRFQVLIWINSKLKYFGTYNTAIEAHNRHINVLNSLGNGLS